MFILTRGGRDTLLGGGQMSMSALLICILCILANIIISLYFSLASLKSIPTVDRNVLTSLELAR